MIVDTRQFKEVCEEIEKLAKIFKKKEGALKHPDLWEKYGKVLFWSLPRASAQVLHALALASGAKKILELGTSVGYSTLWLAAAAKENGGHVRTIEFMEAKHKLAEQYFIKTGLHDQITQLKGHINEIIPTWSSPIDLLFIDADKKNYLTYLQELELYLTDGALVIADNIGDREEDTRNFRNFLLESPSYTTTIIEIDNGLLVAKRKNRKENKRGNGDNPHPESDIVQ